MKKQGDVLTATAESYDSVLATVLDVKLENILGSGSWNIDWFREGTTNSKIEQLKAAGIDVRTLDGDSRVYVFSLIDEEGNVIQDENGKFGQVIKSDLGIPDGFFQKTERNMALVLDAMGYNCLTALDFSEEEMAQIRELAELDNSQLGTSSGKKVTDIYSKACAGEGSVFGKGHGGEDGTENLTQEEMELQGIEPYEGTETTTGTDALKTEKEEAEKEETEKEEETDKTEVSQAKYNSIIENKVEKAAQDYKEETGLEAVTYQMKEFREKAKEEVAEKYAVV
jgi:hypothetical protein